MEIQPNFKGDLLQNVEQFVVDVKMFARDYDEVRILPFNCKYFELLFVI